MLTIDVMCVSGPKTWIGTPNVLPVGEKNYYLFVAQEDLIKYSRKNNIP
jgi:hypothetical protein